MKRSYRGRMALLATLLAGNAAAQQPDCVPQGDPDARGKAEQKIVLLARLVGDTEPVRRVVQSGNARAAESIGGARARVDLANAALDAGCDSAAVGIADEGLALASQAFRLVREQGDVGQENYRRVHARTESYLENLESQPAEVRGIDTADIAGMRRQIERAEEIAIGGDFAAATRLLAPVADRLERRLVAIYDQKTVYYARTFAGPSEEYDYLAQQYRGYRMLIERMDGERQPPHSAAGRYADWLTAAAQLSTEADDHARAGQWDPALEKMREAIGNCERAMKLLGLGF